MKELAHLNKYFIKYKYRFLLGILFVVGSNLFSVFPAKSVQRAIDELTLHLRLGDAAKIDVSGEITAIILECTGLVLLFALIRGIFLFVMRQSLIVMSRKIEYDLKNEIYQHYQQLDQAFYRRNNTGDLMARISEDVSRVRMYIGPAIMYFINLVATFGVVIPAMIGVNAELALYVLLPLPVLSFSIFYVHNIINQRSDAIQEQLSTITSFTQEAYNGIRVIKAFGVEAHSQSALTGLIMEFRRRSMSLAKVDATFFPLMVFLTGLSTILTVFVGGMMVINGKITVGNIAEYVVYVNLLVWPVTALGFTTSLMQRAAASQKRINEFLQTQPTIVSPETPTAPWNERIAFKRVSYTYPGKTTPALSDLSFELRKGTSLGILGSTGSGKSTIAQLMMRMMDVSSGSIQVDNLDLREINLVQYRNRIGYVPQDVFLFSDTLNNNIAFGLDQQQEYSKSRIEAALEDAGLKETLEELKDGGETIIGERGITLSGGQKQRVSIARALIRESEILILDDCLSAIDTRTESFILNRIQQRISGKTALIISHRVSSVKNTDHILILDEGKIIEQGTHLELLEKRGYYFALHQRQTLEETALTEF